MAERLECWTCNPEDPSSSLTLTANWIGFTENLSFKSSATLVSSKLVCLRPIRILNAVMFNLYVDLITYSMALKSPDGELSLEVVFLFFVFCIFRSCPILFNAYERFRTVPTKSEFSRKIPKISESFHKLSEVLGIESGSYAMLFSWDTVENGTCDLHFRRMHTRLKARVCTENTSGIPDPKALHN